MHRAADSASLHLTTMPAIRTELRPGDIGAIVALHGTLYAREYGWDVTFEAYVAEALARFALQHDDARERIWIVEEQGSVAGCIAIVSAGPDQAQLRWYLLAPALRGRGLGSKLLDDAIAFSRNAGYRGIFLWTVSDLTAAARRYRAAGFTLTEAERQNRWGAIVVEERYDLTL